MLKKRGFFGTSNTMMHSKRGQIYVFAAIILCVVLFFLVGKRIFVTEPSVEDDFESLSTNYNFEASKFINSLIKSGEQNIEEKFIQFTTDFTTYSKNQNPDFMLIYVFEYKDRIYLGNYLDGPIWVKSGNDNIYLELNGCFDEINKCIKFDVFKTCNPSNMQLVFGCNASMSTEYPIYALIAGVQYKLDVTSNSPEIVIISKESLDEQKKVYMNDDFVSGQRVADDISTFKEKLSDAEIISTTGTVSMPTNEQLCSSFYSKDSRTNCEADAVCCWNLVKNVCQSRNGGTSGIC